MELKGIKVELIQEDYQPEFNIHDYEDLSLVKNPSAEIDPAPKKRQTFQLSKLSHFSNPNHSYASSIISSPEKTSFSPEKSSLISLKTKKLHYQSISPERGTQSPAKGTQSPARVKFDVKRPVWSANKKKPLIQLSRGDMIFERTSYSPTLSPQRKSIYWQTWLLPSMNSSQQQQSSQHAPKVTAQSYCVMLGDTQQIIGWQNVNIQREIASLTKLMTAYTALNICSTFGIKIREHYVSINKQAAYMNGTSAGLKVDQDILIIDLLYALLLPSGNDAGIAIAQYFGKFLSYKYAQDTNPNDKDRTSMDKFKDFKQFYDNQYDKESLKLFVFQMNKNAHKIGLKNTHFNNSTGLSDKNNFSTAKDMALFTNHCLKNHTLRVMFKKKFHQCEVRNDKLCHLRQIEWKNTNRHLFQFRECIGVKTGITPNAGPCLSSAYKVMGREVIIIVLHCESIEARYKDAEALFKWSRKKIRAF